jgi:hypothetical protein
MSAATVAKDLAPHSPCEIGFISDLLLRSGRGDEGAFARLVDQFFAVVTGSTASSLMSPEDERRVQVAFASVWHNAPTFRPGGLSAVDWIIDVAANA